MQDVVCHVVQRDSSAMKFDRVETTFIPFCSVLGCVLPLQEVALRQSPAIFILALFRRLRPSTDKGGGDTGVPG